MPSSPKKKPQRNPAAQSSHDKRKASEAKGLAAMKKAADQAAANTATANAVRAARLQARAEAKDAQDAPSAGGAPKGGTQDPPQPSPDPIQDGTDSTHSVADDVVGGGLEGAQVQAAPTAILSPAAQRLVCRAKQTPAP